MKKEKKKQLYYKIEYEIINFCVKFLIIYFVPIMVVNYGKWLFSILSY